jgi:hypothetical protein
VEPSVLPKPKERLLLGKVIKLVVFQEWTKKVLLLLSSMGLAPFEAFFDLFELSKVSPLSRIILFLCYKEISPGVKNVRKDPQEYSLWFD